MLPTKDTIPSECRPRGVKSVIKTLAEFKLIFCVNHWVKGLTGENVQKRKSPSVKHNLPAENRKGLSKLMPFLSTRTVHRFIVNCKT